MLDSGGAPSFGKDDTMKLDRYQEQHTELHDQVKELHRHLQALPFEAAGARQSLVTLVAKLNIHLAFEDQALYPTLLKHLNATVQLKTRAYLEEVGGLKAALTAHLQRWLSTQRVLAEPQVFRTETLVFLQALERRLQAEEQDFYPLLERLA